MTRFGKSARSSQVGSKLFLGEPVDAKRSYIMWRVRSKNTGPELRLRQAVTALGARYRIHSALPGRPDLSNQRAKTVVFVDGCFWHGCPIHFTMPKTRRRFWAAKISRNRQRRAEVLAQYESQWTIIQLFECDLKGHFTARARQVALALKAEGE